MGQALGCIQVEESKVAIMEKCGKFNDVLRPGYHFVPWCLGYNLVGRLTLGLQLLDVRCETKTKDNAFVTVFASVQYRCPSNPSKMEAEKVRNAFYNLSNTKAQIRAWVFDVIRERVPKLNLDDAFEQMKEIARAVGNKLKQDMSEYGYEITLTIDIEPDVHVKTAMNDKYAAAIKNEETIEKANTEKLQEIIRAEGDAESKRRLGSGIADQRKAIVDGLRDSMEDFTKHVCGTTGKDVMNMELVTQYFDTMKEIGTSSKASHVFLLHGPDAVKDISAQIRDEILPGKQVEERRLSIH